MEADILIMVALGSFIALVIMSIMFFRTPKNVKKEDERRPQPVANRLREGVPRRAQMARNRGARLRANAAAAQDDEQEQSDDENDVAAANLDISDKVGAKKRAKLEAKAEKKAQREAEEHSRTDKKKREQQAEEDRKKLDDKAKLEEKIREEAELKAKEDKERKEHEEYLKMKEAFNVEEEGFEEGDGEDEQNLLQDFINYIKNQKIILIEDLAAKFKLKTQAAIDRIKDLQSDNILTGVIDDRGKFIYVSQEEMEAVAKFIKQRGRVSIAELAENSNKLINLNPVVTAVK